MSFAKGFQENHSARITNLVNEIKSRRAQGVKPFVNLSLLEDVAACKKVLKPGKVLKLIELGTHELNGSHALTVSCWACSGCGTYEIDNGQYYQSFDCGDCNGNGRVFRNEVIENFEMYDKRRRIEYRREFNVGYRSLWQAVYKISNLDAPPAEVG